MNLDLINYRLERSRESLEDAELLISQNRLHSAVNRLYYSMFYAVVALLETRALSSSKHSGVRALFIQHFVKTGAVSKDTGKFYNDLFRDRQEGDYSDFSEFSKELVEDYLVKCRKYITEIRDEVSRIAISVGN